MENLWKFSSTLEQIKGHQQLQITGGEIWVDDVNYGSIRHGRSQDGWVIQPHSAGVKVPPDEVLVKYFCSQGCFSKERKLTVAPLMGMMN